VLFINIKFLLVRLSSLYVFLKKVEKRSNEDF